MPRKAKGRPPTKRGTKKRCWDALSKSLREKVGFCERCGSTHELQCHHAIVKRKNGRVFLEPRNIAVLCGRCHDWAETHPVAWGWWMDEHRPEDVEYVMSIKEEKVVYTLNDYLDKLAELKEAA